MGSIQTRKTKSGNISYTATVRVKGYPTLCKTFIRRSDAKAWVLQEKVKIQQGSYLDGFTDSKYLLSEAIDRFVKFEKPHPNRLTHLRIWRKVLGNISLLNLTDRSLNKVTAEWKEIGIEGRPIAPATINRYLTSLSAVFQATHRWGWSKLNPTHKAFKYCEPKGRSRFLSDEERESLLEACKASSYPHLYLIVCIAISTGMRKEEILSLKKEQIELNTGVILLQKTKNKVPRKVYLRGPTLRLVIEHATTINSQTGYLFVGKKPSSKKSTPIDPQNRHFDIRNPWTSALKKAQINNFRFHDLRHSCASYLAMNGASTIEIAEVLGHKSLDMVKRYAHLGDSHTASVVERMNNKIFKIENGTSEN